jgi:hypothetical protein
MFKARKGRIRLRRFAGLTAVSAAAVTVLFVLAGGAGAIVAGAGYSTALSNDTCIHGTVINCNAYASKTDVYVSGGPTAGGITTAGEYYFAIVAPGSQNQFLQDGTGDLSLCGSDPVSERTFAVALDPDGNPIIDSYSGSTHATGQINGDGKFVIDAGDPSNLYCDTPNAGGVYILAICSVGATSPSQCKFDAFKVQNGETPPPDFGGLSGKKYYDANADGQLGNGEVGISGWQIALTDSVNQTLTTDASGDFSVSDLAPDTYMLTERQATNSRCVTEVIASVSTLVCSPIWVQSGNTVDQSDVTGAPGSSVALSNFIYTVNLGDTGTVSGLYFGNVCTGAGGGLTLGFWSNKNGQKLFGSDDLALMVSLNLRNANGTDFNPGSYTQFRTWLLGAKATNMAYMLSAQLAAMELNVLNGKVSGGSLVYAPGATGANSSGFISINNLMAEANTELGLHGLTKSGSPYRAYQEALKTALDRANNNLNFVQSGPGSCPAPTFS